MYKKITYYIVEEHFDSAETGTWSNIVCTPSTIVTNVHSVMGNVIHSNTTPTVTTVAPNPG